MELFSSPFDPTAAEFLHSLDMPAYKIASFEIFDIPLIRHCAAFQKPMIISTGMADIAAIDEAVRACREVGNNDIVLLKCTSAYPAPIDKANIATIPFMKSTYGTLAGLSDHTVGDSVAAAATALGACMIEKHFILDHKMDSPDEAFSLDPAEFKQMAELVRNVERAVGKVTYAVQQETAAMRKLARSLFVTEDMAEGESFTAQNLRSIRPGDGLHPRYLPDLLGKKARKAIKKGTPMSWLLVD
jgi:pseudaminic acid synthase